MQESAYQFPQLAGIIIFVCLAISLVMLLIRFFIGPTKPDRLAAFEAFTLVLLCMITIYGLLIGTTLFMDVVLVISLVGFMSTVAIAKFIEQGSINDE